MDPIFFPKFLASQVVGTPNFGTPKVVFHFIFSRINWKVIANPKANTVNFCWKTNLSQPTRHPPQSNSTNASDSILVTNTLVFCEKNSHKLLLTQNVQLRVEKNMKTKTLDNPNSWQFCWCPFWDGENVNLSEVIRDLQRSGYVHKTLFVFRETVSWLVSVICCFQMDQQIFWKPPS